MTETNSTVEHACIEITQLVSSIGEKLCRGSPSFSSSYIFKVPETLRQHDENVFDPNIVSIGPLHHGKHKLSQMEKIKLWYLNCLLYRINQRPPEKSLELFVQSIGQLQSRARECYAEPIDVDDNKFIEMMVLDGCFLIELFRKEQWLVPQHEDDSIFNSPWMLDNIYHDLILLENQIPWFILQDLFELTKSDQEEEKDTFPKLVLRFFDSMMLMTLPAQYIPRKGHEIKHILDLLRSCLLSPKVMLPAETADQKVPPVTDLLRAGIKFKMGKDRDNIFNIEFNNGEFEIPPILIKTQSESLFRNLIAYEKCVRHCTIQFTSYALFLDCLINTVKDVDVLSRERILRHQASAEDIPSMFNRLHSDTPVHECYYGGVSHKVNEYYRSRSRFPRFITILAGWINILVRDYCSDPWRISSVLTAILILLFTGTQTLLAVFTYYNVPPFGKK